MTRSQLWCGVSTSKMFDESEFIKVYKEAFGGPPYFEQYSDEEVREEIVLPHLRDGVVAYATDNDTLVGFGCALPFDRSPEDVQEFLSDLDSVGEIPDAFDYRNAWYMSELGVCISHRGRGIAWALVRQSMMQIVAQGDRQYCMRTARVGSNSMPMFVKSGATLLNRFQDISSTNQATKNLTQSLQRVYLWGDCKKTVARIEAIQSKRSYPLFCNV